MNAHRIRRAHICEHINITIALEHVSFYIFWCRCLSPGGVGSETFKEVLRLEHALNPRHHQNLFTRSFVFHFPFKFEVARLFLWFVVDWQNRSGIFSLSLRAISGDIQECELNERDSLLKWLCNSGGQLFSSSKRPLVCAKIIKLLVTCFFSKSPKIKVSLIV
jgi:hypothetical protein